MEFPDRFRRPPGAGASTQDGKMSLENAGLEALRPRPGSVSASGSPPGVGWGPRRTAGHCPHLQVFGKENRLPYSLLPLTHWHQTPLRPSPGQAPPNHLAACPSTDFKADFHSNPRHCRPSPEGNYPQEGTVRAKDSIQGSPGRWQVSHFSTVESLNRFCEIKASLWSSEELL